MSGRFITLEGGEGAGKSTCMQTVVEVLRAGGKTVIETREPGGTRLAEALRELLLNADMGTVSPQSELLMMFAARAQHLDEKIRPALARDEWVVCDRFTDASFAYQGGGRGLDRAAISWLEQWVHQGLQPDCTLLLDINPELGLSRATRHRDADRFEKEAASFYTRVRDAYLERARKDPQRFRIIDAGQDLDTVAGLVRCEVQRLLDKVT